MAESSYVQELKRKENDLIRVYNPTKEPIVVEWDKKHGVKLFRVPAKKEEVLPRYIAKKFVHEAFDKIVNKKATSAVMKANKDRLSKGMAEMTPWKEQIAFESKFYNLNSEETKKLISILYVGLEREFGVDRLTVEAEKPKGSQDDFEQALEDVETEKDANRVETISKDGKTFKCEYPGCDFETNTNIALHGHKRSHRNEETKDKAVKGVSK